MALVENSANTNEAIKKGVSLNDRLSDEAPKGALHSDGQQKLDKKHLVFLISGIVGFVGGIACLLIGIFGVGSAAAEAAFPKIGTDTKNDTFSDLTGEPLADASLKTAPVYCIQTPNGTDGARPQAGLNEAGVIFEAIAEAGITRFAAIYQNPSSAVIGPIRSLRIYYLQWDTPFDCTIVHAGGAADALATVASGGYKDLSEDYTYMYRGTYGSRLWNNLFTTSAYLKQFSADHGYDTSNIKGFTRMTPDEANKSRVGANAKEKLNIVKSTTADTSETVAGVNSITLNLGGWADFNVHYDYNAETNTYFRSYASGTPHEVYACDATDLGEKNPEDVCSLTQMNPSVVIAMVVQESRASDNYHEDITTIGTGDAYIFQNGAAIKGTWTKGDKDQQIKFFSEDGSEVSLVPGQAFVTAVPSYGSVDY